MQTLIRGIGWWALLVVAAIAAFLAVGRGLVSAGVAVCGVFILAAGMAAMRTMRASRTALSPLIGGSAAAGFTVSLLLYVVDWAAGSGSKPLDGASLLRYFRSPSAMGDLLLIVVPAAVLVAATLVGTGFSRLARRFTGTTTNQA